MATLAMAARVPRRALAPLPSLDAPEGALAADVAVASAERSYPASRQDATQPAGRPCGGYSYPGSPPFVEGSPLFSSRPSSNGSSAFTPVDLHAEPWSSRSTSAASQSSGTLGAAGDLLTTLAAEGWVPNQQAEIVGKAMMPIVKKAMLSKNKAVFQASLDSMRRIESMFGQEAIDHHVESLVEALERQVENPGGDARARIVFETLTAVCSQDMAVDLRQRFPSYAKASTLPAAPPSPTRLISPTAPAATAAPRRPSRGTTKQRRSQSSGGGYTGVRASTDPRPRAVRVS